MSVRGARLNSSSNLSPPPVDVDSEQTFEEIFKLLDVTIKVKLVAVLAVLAVGFCVLKRQ